MGVRNGRAVLVGGYVGEAASAVTVAKTASDVARMSGVGDKPGAAIDLVEVGGMMGVFDGMTCGSASVPTGGSVATAVGGIVDSGDTSALEVGDSASAPHATHAIATAVVIMGTPHVRI